MAPAMLVAVLPLAVLTATLADSDVEPPLDLRALQADDECAAAGSASVGAGSCSVSALQHRAKELQRAAGQAASNATEDEDAVWAKFSASCYGFTGGTCFTDECNADRGASCEAGMCMCPEGTCSGADGKCYRARNLEVASGFRLYNRKFSSYKMYWKRVSAYGQMSTTAMPNWASFGQDEFVLHRVPGNRTAFMLTSKKWPTYAVAMRPTTGTALSPFAAYGVSMNSKTVPWNPWSLMLYVCAPWKQSWGHSIMISSLGVAGVPVWAYVHRGSWLVYGSVTKPGKSGYWGVDPPWPRGTVPDCE